MPGGSINFHVRAHCMVPRRMRFEPHKVLTFCLVRNAEPVFDFKFELAGDEISGIAAETGGKVFPGYQYSVGSLSRQTFVGTVIPEVLSMLVHHRRDETREEHVVDLTGESQVLGWDSRS